MLAVLLLLGICISSCAPPTSPDGSRVALVNRSAPTEDLFNGQFCGGVLIAPDLVATVTHCVSTMSAQVVDVVVGAGNLCKTAAVQGERLQVEEIIKAEPPNEQLSLLRLKGVATGRPLGLTSSSPENGKKVVALGWGQQSDGGVPPCTVKQLPLEIVGMAGCADYAGHLDPSFSQEGSFVCALPSEGEPYNTCQGDSGGPLIVKEGEDWQVAGITLGGASCASDSPGIYIATAAIQDALHEHASP